jgi:hypothetical protein
VCGEQGERRVEPGQLTAGPAGDLAQLGVPQGHAGVGFVQPAGRLAELAEHSVDDHGGDDGFGGLSVDGAVGAVDVPAELVQREGDLARGADRQPPGGDLAGKERQSAEPAGQGELAAVGAGVLLVDPTGGAAGAVQGVQLALLDIGQSGQQHGAQRLGRSEQRGGVGQRLRAGQPGRWLGGDGGDRVEQLLHLR